MDELFERIKILEEENKILENEFNNLDPELQIKKAEHFTKKWLPDKDREENKKKLEEYSKKINDYKKLLDENLNFPKNTDPNNITLPATLKNQNFNEIEILNFFKLINEEKKRINNERQKNLDILNKKLDPKKEADPKFNSIVNEFEKYFKGRIINHNNSNYLIKFFDRKFKNIQAMMLYDSNGIKVNEKIHDKLRLYNSIEVKDLFENSYILSKEESEVIKNDYKNDNTHFIKIFYQMQIDKRYPTEKELITYKIETN